MPFDRIISSISSSPFEPSVLPTGSNLSNSANQISPSSPPSAYTIGQPIMLTPEIHSHDCKPHNCSCNLPRPRTAPSTSSGFFGSGSGPSTVATFSGYSGYNGYGGYTGSNGVGGMTDNGSGVSLSDVQKRRRAVAFNQFASYNEAVPFRFQKSMSTTFHATSKSGSKLGRDDNDAERAASTDVEDASRSSSGSSPSSRPRSQRLLSHKPVLSTHSVPDFHSRSDDSWSRHMEHVVKHISPTSPSSFAQIPAVHNLKDVHKTKPRRKSSVGFIHGLKSLLNPKQFSPESSWCQKA